MAHLTGGAGCGLRRGAHGPGVPPIYNVETLTDGADGATAVLVVILLLGCLGGMVWAARSQRRNAPAPYWLLRHEHRLKHLFGESHNCLDALTDHRPDWY